MVIVIRFLAFIYVNLYFILTLSLLVVARMKIQENANSFFVQILQNN